MRVCSFCGENNEDWMNICQRCGNSIVNADVKQDVDVQYSYAVNNTKYSSKKNTKNESKKENKFIDVDDEKTKEKRVIENLDLKLILIILLIILICLIIYTISTFI